MYTWFKQRFTSNCPIVLGPGNKEFRLSGRWYITNRDLYLETTNGLWLGEFEIMEIFGEYV